jgi:hypothetical protein
MKKILFIFILSLSLVSCKKGSIETNYGPNLQVASDHVMLEQTYTGIFNLFYRVVSDSILVLTGSRSIFSASCTYDEDPFITYTIDYGSSFRVCPDRIKRKGSIVAVLDKSFTEYGAAATLSFNDFSFIDNPEDTIMVEGENQIVNLGYSISDFQSYEHAILSNKITVMDTLDSLQSHWNATRFIELVEGNQTPGNFYDDVFTLIGESNGSATNGVVFSSSIVDSVGNFLNCHWLRTGTIDLTTPGLDIKSGTVVYIGQDTCINRVKYIFNGNDFYEDLLGF